MAATNLGTAYIKIAPQMSGIQKSISDGLAGIKSSSLPGATALGTVIAKGVSAAMNTVTGSLDKAIERTDIINNFPKVMSNLGIGANDAQKSISKLKDKLDGLPTSLQAGASAVQRFTSKNGDIQRSTDLFLALNNAILAGGAPAEIQANAIEQMSQAYAKGKPDMMEWRAIQSAMPAQLNQIAEAMGIGKNAAAELGEGLRKGEISMDDFMSTIITLNTKGVNGFKSFEEQAKNSTAGIGTALTNVKNRIAAAIEKIINAFGQKRISDAINNFSASFGRIADWIVKYMIPPITDVVIPALKSVMTIIGNLFKAIGENEVASKALAGVIYAFAGFKVLKSVLPIIKGAGSIVGNFASKLNIFKGASSLGSGVGNVIAGILKPLGKKEVLMGASSAALVAAGVWAFAQGIAKVSSSNIDWGKVLLLEVNMAAITAIIAAIGKFAGVGALIGGIATAVIGGGLWVFASGLAALSPKLGKIDWPSIYALTGHLAVLSLILTSIVGLAIFGAVSSVATAIIGGGLLATALALEKAGIYAKKINLESIIRLSEVVAIVSTILGLIVGLAIFGAVSSICNAVISGGLLVAAMALQETAKYTNGLNKDTFQKLTDCLGQVSSALAIASLWSAFGAIGSIFNAVITGGVLVAAMALKEASGYIKSVKEADYDRLSNVFKKIQSWETGGILDSFGKMLSSGNLKEVALHVKDTAVALSNMPELPSDETIERIKAVIKSLSAIEVRGSGFGENRGGAAEELEKIATHAVNIAYKVNGMPTVDASKVEQAMAAINKFGLITPGALTGLKLLSDARGHAEAIPAITDRLTRISDGIVERAAMFVKALQTLAGFDGTLAIESAGRAVSNLVSTVLRVIESSYSSMVNAGRELALRVLDGINSTIMAFDNSAGLIVDTLRRSISSAQPILVTAGKDMANKIKSGVNAVVAEGGFRSSGVNAGNGVINGLKATYLTAYNAGRNLAAKLIQGVKDRGKEGSPWKTTFQSGVFAGEGLAEGLLSTRDDVVSAANVIADATQEALGLNTQQYGSGLVNTQLQPQTGLTSALNGSGGQVIQYNDFNVDSELDVKEISKRLGWQVATAL
jgi:tape measure domain-containing protein